MGASRKFCKVVSSGEAPYCIRRSAIGILLALDSGLYFFAGRISFSNKTLTVSYESSPVANRRHNGVLSSSSASLGRAPFCSKKLTHSAVPFSHAYSSKGYSCGSIFSKVPECCQSKSSFLRREESSAILFDEMASIAFECKDSQEVSKTASRTRSICNVPFEMFFILVYLSVFIPVLIDTG